MILYIIRRLLAAVGLVVVLSMITFAIFYLMPRLAGASPETLATRYVGRSSTGATVEQRAESLGFYDPVPVQYWNWLKGVLFGTDVSTGADTVRCPAPCLGYSFKTQDPVLPEILDRLPVSFSLAIGAAVIWLVLGVSIGVLSALKRGSFFDRAAMTLALAGVSLPIFWTGLLALSIFSYQLGWTPPGGSYTPFSESPLDWAFALLLPWVTLALLFSAQYARLTRAGMLETMSEDYIRTARAKGLPERTVVAKHGLRGALTPIVTIFGLDFGLLIGSAVLTESVFGLPGLGALAVDSTRNNDLPMVLGVVLLVAVFVAVANLVVDLLYAVIDPRVRTR
ncbi:ABC transporter permease [Nocardioides aequoreus]|uniref:ABC transporter permease n=1 Tax=Nocardioides aequoreus TaxID=397278 RepID=UPI0004C443B4|nr:ABC transporter permease [Nocardioides aequoreus]